MFTVNQKCNHLINRLGFKRNELTEIKKMYEGDFFNPEDPSYLKLLEISANLCQEFSTLTGTLGKKPSLHKQIKVLLRKNKILDLLFPGHGTLSGVGENLQTVIGLIDFKGCGYLNREVIFSPYTFAECENYTIFATKIHVGNNVVEKKDNLIKLGKIHFGHDCWICAGATVQNNISIGSKSVVGAGANVTTNVPDSCLSVGRPNCTIAAIDKNYKSNKLFNVNRSPEQMYCIKQNLKLQGFKFGLKEYYKSLKGINFNCTDINLGRIYILSHRLCSEYNNLQTPQKRKDEIIDILFPCHGKNLKIGTDLFVDLLGTTILGDNVTIGDHVYLAGNVLIENNVTVGDNVLLYATGHSLQAKERHVGFSITKGMFEYSQASMIELQSDITIGNDCIIVPGTVVSKSIPNGCLVTNKKIIF